MMGSDETNIIKNETKLTKNVKENMMGEQKD